MRREFIQKYLDELQEANEQNQCLKPQDNDKLTELCTVDNPLEGEEPEALFDQFAKKTLSDSILIPNPATNPKYLIGRLIMYGYYMAKAEDMGKATEVVDGLLKKLNLKVKEDLDK